MPYPSFDDVLPLDRARLQQLLATGDPVERVWAAWALALRFERTVLPELVAAVAHGPAFLRRHLVVVLAGLGEHGVIQVLAATDRDDFVRATACQYLARTGGVGDEQAQHLLLDRLCHDASPLVRLAVLRECERGLPAVTCSQLSRLLDDPEPELRELAGELWRKRCQ